MDENERVILHIASLADEAIKDCNELYDYTYSNFHVFSGNDEKMIAEVIRERESMVNALINIEYRIDLFVDSFGNNDYGSAGRISGEIDGLRQTARSILSMVMDMDIKAMGLLSEKMQKYKDETLKARNKKNLSAYIKTGIVRQRGLHYDCKK